LLFQKLVRSAANSDIVSAVSASSVRIAELASVEIRSIRNAAHAICGAGRSTKQYDTESRPEPGLEKRSLDGSLENKQAQKLRRPGKQKARQCAGLVVE
jgi:uncharacterized protein YaaN involved in tellurite resistance